MTESLKNLNLSNNFLFCKVLSDKDVCKALLEEIMGFEIADLQYCDIEKTMEPDGESKGIRIDVIVKDKEGNIYDIEMQNRNTGDISFRSRYYQSVMDIEHLDKGDGDYRNLPKTCIIFFTTFDMFGDGKMKHVFRHRDD
ncbi:MAG: Rpn family recombination-promoting nuclease/putative transposase [Clostridia bacterium]|nr:Rpn family recombination-promoting nuclease/putative transposase [Clostridia bacterium]